jgi:opacity protein-like surface antigen
MKKMLVGVLSIVFLASSLLLVSCQKKEEPAAQTGGYGDKAKEGAAGYGEKGKEAAAGYGEKAKEGAAGYGEKAK